jgi:hypothetical protein
LDFEGRRKTTNNESDVHFPQRSKNSSSLFFYRVFGRFSTRGVQLATRGVQKAKESAKARKKIHRASAPPFFSSHLHFAFCFYIAFLCISWQQATSNKGSSKTHTKKSRGGSRLLSAPGLQAIYKQSTYILHMHIAFFLRPLSARPLSALN